jgi:hypothetical protein
VLAKIADNLMHQYVLTYTNPAGVKLNEKLSLTTRLKGVTLLAPSRLPDKERTAAAKLMSIMCHTNPRKRQRQAAPVSQSRTQSEALPESM